MKTRQQKNLIHPYTTTNCGNMDEGLHYIQKIKKEKKIARNFGSSRRSMSTLRRSGNVGRRQRRIQNASSGCTTLRPVARVSNNSRGTVVSQRFLKVATELLNCF